MSRRYLLGTSAQTPLYPYWVPRARTNEGTAEQSGVYKVVKLVLNKDIDTRKWTCLDNLCQSANTGVRGCLQDRQKIAETLFSRYDSWPWGPVPNGSTSQNQGASVTNEDLITIAKTLNVNKAPGPDAIPIVAVVAAIATRLTQLYLDRGEFLGRGK